MANFSSYNKTYGAIGGVIVSLLWLWILNMSLLFGAEFDAEMERGRQLQAGIEAEETIQLPPRDTKQSDKLQDREEEDIRRGRELREQHGDAGQDAGHVDGGQRRRAPGAAAGPGSPRLIARPPGPKPLPLPGPDRLYWIQLPMGDGVRLPSREESSGTRSRVPALHHRRGL